MAELSIATRSEYKYLETNCKLQVLSFEISWDRALRATSRGDAMVQRLCAFSCTALNNAKPWQTST